MMASIQVNMTKLDFAGSEDLVEHGCYKSRRG